MKKNGGRTREARITVVNRKSICAGLRNIVCIVRPSRLRSLGAPMAVSNRCQVQRTWKLYIKTGGQDNCRPFGVQTGPNANIAPIWQPPSDCARKQSRQRGDTLVRVVLPNPVERNRFG